MIKSLILIITLLFSQVSLADGICTGFFITSDGYIGTAAHCAGKNLTIFYTKNKQGLRTEAYIIAIDTEHDTMLLKIKEQDVDSFALNINLPKPNDAVAYIGFPEPEKYGWFKHIRYGKVDSLDNRYINIDIWSRPGTSGSPIFTSNSEVIGILTIGYVINGQEVETGARYISYLVNLAILNQAKISLGMKSFDKIDDTNITQLLSEDRDKIVLIYIH